MKNIKLLVLAMTVFMFLFSVGNPTYSAGAVDGMYIKGSGTMYTIEDFQGLSPQEKKQIFISAKGLQNVILVENGSVLTMQDVVDVALTNSWTTLGEKSSTVSQFEQTNNINFSDFTRVNSGTNFEVISIQ